MLQTHARRRDGAAVRHALERLRHRPLPAHRAGAVPQALRRRRARAGLRDQPQLPQRGRRLARTRPSSRCSSSTRRTPTTTTMATHHARAHPGGRARGVAARCSVTRADGADARPRRASGPQVDLYDVAVRGRRRARSRPTTPRRAAARRCATTVGIELAPDRVPGKYVEELFEHHVVADLHAARPSSWTTPSTPRRWCARTARKPGVVEKWDLYIDGFELGTGYSELVDPVIQRERLVEQAALGGRRRRRGDAARRGLPARARARHAAVGRRRAWASTGC